MNKILLSCAFGLMLAGAVSALAQTNDLLQVNKTVSPQIIWARGLGRTPDTAVVTLTVKAFGDTTMAPIPIDVMFVIDHSSSMTWRDACSEATDRMTFAHQAVAKFVHNMQTSDRAGLLYFWGSFSQTGIPWPAITPLTSDTAVLMDSLQNMAAQGGTYLVTAIDSALNYMQTHGRSGVTKAVVVLTDGATSEANQSTLFTRISTLSGSIKVFAVGLGSDEPLASKTKLLQDGEVDTTQHRPDTMTCGDCCRLSVYGRYWSGTGSGLDTAFLKNVAQASNTPFYYSKFGTDLGAIYASIARSLRYYAIAQLAPGNPLVIDKIPLYVTFRSWQATARNQTFIQRFTNTNNRLAWEIPQIGVNSTLEMSYVISSTQPGWNDLFTDTNFVTYLDAFNRPGNKVFPPARVQVVTAMTDTGIRIIDAVPLDHTRIRLEINTANFSKYGIDSVYIYQATGGWITNKQYEHLAVPAQTLTSNGNFYTVSGLAETTLYYFTVTMKNFVGEVSNVDTTRGDTARTLPFKWRLVSHVSNFPNPCIASAVGTSRALTKYEKAEVPAEHGTLLRYDLNRDSRVTIAIYDAVRVPVYKIKLSRGADGAQAGINFFYWTGRNQKGRLVESGSYLLVIQVRAQDGTEDEARWKIGVAQEP